MTGAEGPIGLVLAAGAGRRAGGPKALRRLPDGTPWVEHAVRTLAAGGCDGVLVVLGAGATQARPLVPEEASVVVADNWADGIGASLHRGLAAAATTTATAALISLVDLPGLPVLVVRRVLGFAPVGPESMLRAGYGGRPGHPVLLGRNHWQPLRDTGSPDRAAGPYLRDHGAPLVECADLWDGADIDRPGT
ncbi:NTP transferase domain-containing protein [Naumannella halotolerans]|uniref:Molybdenum cofactor cytidylyltransferase n=1 Tax=Naumannella halotolerans TaxID=993414 RepID=A0A4R7J0S9_9ACTN|nr:NTP transferase domain-containing protein [Naumannella halotolerans]TDT29839.1 molybdenum cofactor cytidylyltransferase [Naumannella halotolerans]